MSYWVQTRAVLTVREVHVPEGGVDLEGTEQAREILSIHPQSFRPTEGTYLLLIHGYNVTFRRARFAYSSFRWWLEHFRVPAQVLEFHWPGNERWGKISGACYPLKVRPAQACGAVLADWIRKSDDTVNFVLISHSLGGRLLMEAVQNLYLNGGIFRVQAACLMAPAVPVPYVERGSLGPQSNDGVRWRLLYSKDDSVLKNLFTIGQDAAFDEIHSDAVGFTGEPEIKWPDRWETHQPATRMKRASGYDHGWYWYGGPDSGEPPLTPLDGRPLLETPPQKRNGGESAHIIANLLGASVARRLPDRTLPEMPPLKARVLAFLRP